MKKIILILLIVVAMVLTMAVAPKLRLSRFTVVNKSGGPIAVRLTPKTAESNMPYFLNIKSGDKSFPTTAVYTVQHNKYDVVVYFYKEVITGSVVEVVPICTLWNYPDLGYYPPSVDLTRNNKMTVLPCNQYAEPVSLGEDGFWKYWYPGYVGFIDEPEPAFKWNWVPIWDYVY